MTKSVLVQLHAWAYAKPNIQKLWLYGSRAAGTATSSSDIDLAFLIDPLRTDQEKLNFYSEVFPSWLAETKILCPWPVHLEPWAGDATPVAGAIRSCSILIYERTAFRPYAA